MAIFQFAMLKEVITLAGDELGKAFEVSGQPLKLGDHKMELGEACNIEPVEPAYF